MSKPTSDTQNVLKTILGGFFDDDTKPSDTGFVSVSPPYGVGDTMIQTNPYHLYQGHCITVIQVMIQTNL